MSLKIYVPGDAAALSVGADAVARAIKDQIASRRLDATVIRNGSRGMFWLEPLVEVHRRQLEVLVGEGPDRLLGALFLGGLIERGRVLRPEILLGSP